MIDLRLGDCLEIMKSIPDKSIDLVLTDPPYNFEAQGGGLFKKRGNLDRIEKSFGTDFTPEQLLDLCEQKCKNMHGYFYCSKAIVRNYLNWAQDRGYGFNILLWHKENPIPCNKNNFLPDTEYCIFIRGKNTTFVNGLQFNLYRKYWITPIEKRPDHPTPKPLELMEKHILISSEKGQTVLDPFMGSGTTGVACKELDRNFIGIEISEKYFKIAERRINQTMENLL
jgi:site-specific DNA-methyltransferase (adenine-specific)